MPLHLGDYSRPSNVRYMSELPEKDASAGSAAKMSAEKWNLSCPECGKILLTAELKGSEYITNLTALCSSCVKLVKYSKGMIKADELQKVDPRQKRLA